MLKCLILEFANKFNKRFKTIFKTNLKFYIKFHQISKFLQPHCFSDKIFSHQCATDDIVNSTQAKTNLGNMPYNDLTLKKPKRKCARHRKIKTAPNAVSSDTTNEPTATTNVGPVKQNKNVTSSHHSKRSKFNCNFHKKIPEFQYPKNLNRPMGNDSLAYRACADLMRIFMLSMRFVPYFNKKPKMSHPICLQKLLARHLRYDPKQYRHGKRIHPKCNPKLPTKKQKQKQNFPEVTLDFPTIISSYLTYLLHSGLLQTFANFYTQINSDQCQDDGSNLHSMTELINFLKEKFLKYTVPVDHEGFVPFFPEMESVLNKKVGGVSGYMDAKGFHVAEMGDSIPEKADIGYIGQNGKFCKVESVAKGIQLGLIGLRNAQVNIIGPLNLTKSTCQSNQIPQEILLEDDHWISLCDFVTETTKKKRKVSHVQKSFTTQRLPLVKKSRKSRKKSMIPGFLDEDGTFQELVDDGSKPFPKSLAAFRTKSGEVFSIDGIPLSKDSVVLNTHKPEKILDEIKPKPGIEPLPQGMVGKVIQLPSHLNDADFLMSIPQGGIAGWIDSNGKFMELFANEKLPSGAPRAYLTW